MSDGLRQAGPHRVRDVEEKGKSGRSIWTVTCVKCNAEWSEGGIYPKHCGLFRVPLSKLLSWMNAR